MSINYTHCKNVLWLTLTDFFKNLSIVNENTFAIDDNLIIRINEDMISLEWYASGVNDILADSIAMLVYQLENYPNSEIFSHYMNKDSLCSYKKKRLLVYLKTKYQGVEEKENNIYIENNGEQGIILDFPQHSLICKNEELEKKIKADLDYFDTL